MAEGEKLDIRKLSKYPENLTLVILVLFGENTPSDPKNTDSLPPPARSPPRRLTMPIYGMLNDFDLYKFSNRYQQLQIANRKILLENVETTIPLPFRIFTLFPWLPTTFGILTSDEVSAP